MDSTTDQIELAYAVQTQRMKSIADADPADITPRICRSCGGVFPRRKRDKLHYCPDCAARRQIASGQQAAARTGPDYAATVAAQLWHWTMEARRLGIDPPGPT